MKLAFISDIHANLPALKAVLNEIDKHNPDDIYCLGDLVNFAGWDNEVIALIRKNNISCIQGNHDEGIGRNQDNFPFSYQNEAQKDFGLKSAERVNNNITDANRNYLSYLPFLLKLEFHFPFQNIKITMVHGSVSSNNEYVKESVGDKYLLEMMDAIDTDILLMGHTHIPFHHAIFCEDENRRIYKHAVNVGSVGKPKQGDNLACYATMEIDENTALYDPDSFHFQFHYIKYDVEKVIRKIKEIGLSNAYDTFLREGYGHEKDI